MKQKIFLIAALLLCTGFANAQYYTITSHTTDITVDEEGFAAISEKFFLSFPNDVQLMEFQQKNEEIGISLEKWKEFDSKIHTYIGREEEINRAEVVFVKNNAKYLEIKYSLNTPIAEKKGETSRIVEFSVINRFFDEFLQGSVIIIPENTAITIKLPSSAEIEPPVKPEAITTANQVTWQGYKSSNILSLNYRIIKQIASINLQENINALTKSPLFIVLIIIVVIIAGILFIKRKTLEEKIEGYIVEHSELGQKEEYQEEKEAEM